jgi:hypothetical protein
VLSGGLKHALPVLFCLLAAPSRVVATRRRPLDSSHN